MGALHLVRRLIKQSTELVYANGRGSMHNDITMPDLWMDYRLRGKDITKNCATVNKWCS